MLFLSAVIRLAARRESEPHDLLAESRQRLGSVGLTVIALVLVLLAFWRN